MSDRVEIIEVLARYVRAMEERRAQQVAELFTPEGVFELFSRRGREEYVAAGLCVIGRENIQALVEGGSVPATQGVHYVTTDHIVDITGEQANMQAQFMAVESNADVKSDAASWTTGSGLVRGALAISMFGRYESSLRKVDGRWLFSAHRVMHNLPVSLPASK